MKRTWASSGAIARDDRRRFPLFGVPCGAPVDGHQMFMTAAVLRRGDVVVAISNTGTTREVIQATRLARESGAATIGITGPDNPIPCHWDIGIIVDTLENTSIYTPTISRVAPMVVIDSLSTSVRPGRDAAHGDRVADMKRPLAEICNGEL